MFCSKCGKEQPDGSRFCSGCGVTLADTVRDAGPPQTAKKKMSGCMIALIVAAALGVLAVPVIGIISAIAVPNLLNAIDRGKQKRTMADLRTVAVAIESYAIEHDVYPTAADIETLGELLVPDHAPQMQAADAWTRSFVVESNPSGYRIYSLGKDGIPDGCPGGSTQAFNADICFADGEFTQWPEGAQR